MILSISSASKVLGVAISTLRRWDYEGYFHPDFRTIGGHRRYSLSTLKSKFEECFDKSKLRPEKLTILYSRVSGSDQRPDLERQKSRLEYHAKNMGFSNTLSIFDVGSGLKCNKPGLKKLIKLILEDKVERLVLEHTDRLLRFGTEIIFQLCKWKGIEVCVLEKELDKTFEQELTQDIICLMVVFTARLYGRRSHKNRVKEKKSTMQNPFDGAKNGFHRGGCFA